MNSGNPEYDASVKEMNEEMLRLDRRSFWEMCAARQPAFDDSGFHNDTPQGVASWADDMLAEWDKRWNKENANAKG